MPRSDRGRVVRDEARVAVREVAGLGAVASGEGIDDGAVVADRAFAEDGDALVIGPTGSPPGEHQISFAPSVPLPTAVSAHCAS